MRLDGRPARGADRGGVPLPGHRRAAPRHAVQRHDPRQPHHPGQRTRPAGRGGRAAACEDFAADLDVPVGEDGNRLSGGQRQRLALARALATDAPVLVLHDPTTAVDSVTEQTIADRLRGVRAGRSTLIASSPALARLLRQGRRAAADERAPMPRRVDADQAIAEKDGRAMTARSE